LSENSDSVSVKIPKNLYAKLEDKIRGTEFKSVQDYLSFLVTQVLGTESDKSSQGLSKEDEEQIKEKLSALGYL
jgi:Arc/MetJ-type ribon-helix-helix transcriptional regulator